jgi:hypothetical protein
MIGAEIRRRGIGDAPAQMLNHERAVCVAPLRTAGLAPTPLDPSARTKTVDALFATGKLA